MLLYHFFDFDTISIRLRKYCDIVVLLVRCCYVVSSVRTSSNDETVRDRSLVFWLDRQSHHRLTANISPCSSTRRRRWLERIPTARIIVLERFLTLVGVKVLSLCYFFAILCLLHYWLNREKWFSIIRLYTVTILFCESCVLCIVMRPKKLSSMYHIFPGHSSSIDIKRAVWSSFVRVLTI